MLYAGNCWFLASIGALTFQNDVLGQVVPLEQTFGADYCGLFHFRVNTIRTNWLLFFSAIFSTLMEVRLSVIYCALYIMLVNGNIIIYERI